MIYQGFPLGTTAPKDRKPYCRDTRPRPWLGLQRRLAMAWPRRRLRAALETLVNHWFLLVFWVFWWFFGGFWSKNHGY